VIDRGSLLVLDYEVFEPLRATLFGFGPAVLAEYLVECTSALFEEVLVVGLFCDRELYERRRVPGLEKLPWCHPG
jgi:hypothetical protein